MIYGFDVSTTCVGISVLDRSENLVYYTHKKLLSSMSLEERAEIVMVEFGELVKRYSPCEVYVEEPAKMFGSKSTAHTMGILNRFNGMICYGIHCVTGVSPGLVNVRVARRILGIRQVRGMSKREVKKSVIDYIEGRYEGYSYEVTRYGNPRPGTDDECDAIVIALAGMMTNGEE